jgi:hypothetical protein
MRAVWAGFFVLGFTGVPSLAAPQIIDLAPHRAVYSMVLASARPGSGIAGASGVMTYEFGDACDGWTVENKTILNFAYNEGANAATVWDFSTWEAKDGLRYRFRVRNVRDGQTTEEIDGEANIKGNGQAGAAKFTLPQPMTKDLPKGTLFPTEHTVQLIKAAQDGKPILLRTVFDGTGMEGPFAVNAVIGRPATADEPGEVDSPLTRILSWHMDMAFFPVGSQEASPDYEVGLRYLANGVARNIIQNFGNFSLKGKLERIEPLAKPDC